MADLPYVQEAQEVKVTGQDSTGNTVNYVGATATGDLEVNDGLRSGGVYGNLNLVTANTAYEVRVGGSRLTSRKVVTIIPIDSNMYWGYDSGVTTATGS